MTIFTSITKFWGMEFIFSPQPSPINSFKKNPKEGTFNLSHDEDNEITYEFTNFTGTVTMRKQKNVMVIEKEVIDLNTPTPKNFKKINKSSPAFYNGPSPGFRSTFSRSPTPGNRSK